MEAHFAARDMGISLLLKENKRVITIGRGT